MVTEISNSNYWVPFWDTMQRQRITRTEVPRTHRTMEMKTSCFLQMSSEIRLPTFAGSLKQAILDYRAAKTSNLAHQTGSHSNCFSHPRLHKTSLEKQFAVRIENMQDSNFLSWHKFIDIWGTKLDTSRASTEQCCHLQECYELSPADVGTAITTQAHTLHSRLVLPSSATIRNNYQLATASISYTNAMPCIFHS
jgi:hypothetical protein